MWAIGPPNDVSPSRSAERNTSRTAGPYTTAATRRSRHRTVTPFLPAPRTMPSMASLTDQPILVVDDDAKIVRLVRTYLERAGYRVVEATDGRAALSAI